MSKGFFNFFKKKSSTISTDANTKDQLLSNQQSDIQNSQINTTCTDSNNENQAEELSKSSVSDNREENAIQTLDVNTDHQTENVQKNKISFFERLKRTRENLAYGLEAMIKGKQISEDLYEDLETALRRLPQDPQHLPLPLGQPG